MILRQAKVKQLCYETLRKLHTLDIRKSVCFTPKERSSSSFLLSLSSNSLARLLRPGLTSPRESSWKARTWVRQEFSCCFEAVGQIFLALRQKPPRPPAAITKLSSPLCLVLSGFVRKCTNSISSSDHYHISRLTSVICRYDTYMYVYCMINLGIIGMMQ